MGQVKVPGGAGGDFPETEIVVTKFEWVQTSLYLTINPDVLYPLPKKAEPYEIRIEGYNTFTKMRAYILVAFVLREYNGFPTFDGLGGIAITPSQEGYYARKEWINASWDIPKNAIIIAEAYNQQFTWLNEKNIDRYYIRKL